MENAVMENLGQDLRQDKKILQNRAQLKAVRKTFGWLPVVRDFIAERILGRGLKLPQGRCVVPTQYGYDMLVAPREGGIVEASIYRAGSYESGVIDIINRVLQPGDTVVDAGANVGVITAHAAHCVGPQGCVWAFEPVPTTAEFLQATVALNNFTQVKVHQMALSNAAGEAPIFASNSVNRGGLSLEAQDHAQKAAQVKLERLDNLMDLQQWKQVKLMKIDVEGWELEVLQGAQKLFETQYCPVMIVEYGQEDENKARKLYEALKGLPTARIYKMLYTKRARGPLVEVRCQKDLPKADNLVIVPEWARAKMGV